MITPWSPTTGWRPWRRATLATMVCWAVTVLVVVVATATVGANEPVGVAADVGFRGMPPPPVDATGLELLRTGLVRFDALWYLSLAADGYPATTSVPGAAAFLPGYPLVVGLVARVLGGDVVLAGLLVSFAATVASIVGLQRLAELVALGQPDLEQSDLRTRTLVLTLAFPTAFFLVAPYAESLLLATSVWALVHATRGRPLASGALAALATVTRPVGVLLAVPLLLGVVGSGRPDEGWWQDTAARRRVLRERLLPTLGVAAGGVALLLHGWARWGDPLAVVAAQDGWQRETTLPTTALVDGLRIGLRTIVDGAAPYHLLDVLVLGLTVTGLVALARRREWPLVAHGVVSALLWLSQPFPARPLMSTPRFALAVPAVLVGLAVAARGDGLGRAVLPISAVLFTVHLVLFTRWWFVF